MENADKKAPVKEAMKAKDSTEPKPTIFIDIKVEGGDMEDPNKKQARKHPKLMTLCCILWLLTFWAFLWFLMVHFLFFLFMWVGVDIDMSWKLIYSYIILFVLLTITVMLQLIFFSERGNPTSDGLTL